MKKRMIVPVFLLLLIVWALTVLVAATDMETYGKKSLQNDLRFSSVVGPGGNGSNAGGTVSVRPFTVTFDANGGTVEPATKTYRVLRGVYGELPTPFREGYAFAGWYTELDGGTQVNSGTTLSRIDHTLYAHWREIEIIASGYCGAEDGGKNLTWALDSEGTLTIDGTGAMENYYRPRYSVAPTPWVDNRSIITSLKIVNGVTSVGTSAFSGCNSLTSLTIPNSITRIEEWAFSGCSSLTSLAIPDSVTHIGDYAFYGCGLTSLTIPDNITSIGFQTFFSCKALKSVTIPDSITSIGGVAFGDCSSLTSVTIPSSVISVGYKAFSGCGSLTSVTIPDSVIQIGGFAFYGCNSLTNLTIPNSVTDIGDGAFYGCSSLTSIMIPDNITTICDQVFRDCSSLTSVMIPDGVRQIGDRSFYNCSSLISITIPDSVLSIRGCAFSGCSSLVNVKIPDSVISIGEWGFSGCSSLTDLTIPDSVTSIGERAFSDCNSLISVTISNSVTSISACALYGCSSLTSLIIPDSITSFGYAALAGCNSLKDIYYAGDESQWNAISGHGNIPSTATIHYESAPPDEPSAEPTVTKKPITFANKGSYTLLVGGTLEVTAVIPDAEQSDYQGWTMEDDEVIYRTHSKTFVLDGLLYATTTVQGISPGERTLTVSAKDGRSATCTITVLPRIEISETASSTFNADVYRADWLLDIGNHPMAKSVRNLLNEDTPSHMLCKAGEDNGLLTAIHWWDAVKAVSEGVDDPSTVADLFYYDPIDAYAAIILNTLEEISSNDKGALGDYFDWAANVVEGSGKLLGDTSDIASTFKDSLNSYAVLALNIPDLQNLDALSAETKKKLREWAGEYFETLYPDDNDFIEGLGITASGVQLAGDIYSYAQRVASYYALAHYGAQIKSLLREMYRESESSGDVYLKSALTRCIAIMDSAVSGMMLEILDGAYVVTTGMLSVFWDEVKTVLYKFPAVLVWQTAYKISSSFSNFLFKTQDTVDAFSKMQSIYAVETISDRVYQKAMEQFSTSKNAENAALYLTSMDFVFALRGQDCQHAYDYVNALDASGVNTIWKIFGNDTYASSKAALSSLQKSYHITHESALTAWIYALQEDPQYSSLYPTYEHLIEQSFERTKKKKFVAACPVDVYVYNAENQVVAAVANGVVSSVDTIDAALLGEKKVFWFYDDHPYRVEYIGNASGAMDVTITEFGEAQEITRTVNYYDVQLTNGLIYQMDAPASESTQNPVPYELKDSVKTTVVNYDYDSVLAQSSSHTLKVVSGTLVHDGISSTSTEAKKGETITLNAYVPAGYEFVRWNVTAGTDVSLNATDQSATLIMPEQDVTVEAVLQIADTAVVRADGVQTGTGSTVNAKVCCVGNSAATVYCAFYNDAGKMLSVDIKSANSGENDLSFTTTSVGVATAKLMVLDSQMIPQCDSKAVEII